MNRFRPFARRAAILGLGVYATVGAVLLSIIASEGNGDMVVTFAVLFGPLFSALLFARGTAHPTGNAGRFQRILGWIGMVAGSVALISFSFIVWPALILAAPYAFARE